MIMIEKQRKEEQDLFEIEKKCCVKMVILK